MRASTAHRKLMRFRILFDYYCSYCVAMFTTHFTDSLPSMRSFIYGQLRNALLLQLTSVHRNRRGGFIAETTEIINPTNKTTKLRPPKKLDSSSGALLALEAIMKEKTIDIIPATQPKTTESILIVPPLLLDMITPPKVFYCFACPDKRTE